MLSRDRNAELDSQEIEILKITQSIINRMADNSQKTKTIFLSLCAAGIVLANSKVIIVSWPQLSIACAFALLLWIIDARYLELERRFRKHYLAVVNGIPNLDAWGLDIRRYPQENICKVMTSFSLWMYPALIVCIVLLYCL